MLEPKFPIKSKFNDVGPIFSHGPDLEALDPTKSGPSLVEIASSSENQLLLIEQAHRSSSSILLVTFFETPCSAGKGNRASRVDRCVTFISGGGPH